MKRVFATAAVAGLAVTELVIGGPTASATTTATAPPGYGTVATCPGSVWDTFPVGPGTLQIWRSSVNSGTVCAKLFDNLAGSHYMDVSIQRSDWVTVWHDAGTFTTYAGGVTVYGVTSGKCAYVNAKLNVNGTVYSGGSAVCGP